MDAEYVKKLRAEGLTTTYHVTGITLDGQVYAHKTVLCNGPADKHLCEPVRCSVGSENIGRINLTEIEPGDIIEGYRRGSPLGEQRLYFWSLVEFPGEVQVQP